MRNISNFILEELTRLPETCRSLESMRDALKKNKKGVFYEFSGILVIMLLI